MQTKSDSFKPNKKMYLLLNARLNSDIEASITAECKYANISRDTYYRWMKNEDFATWFDNEFQKEIKKMQSLLDKIGLQKARNDFRYWEAMQMKYFNYAKKEKQEVVSSNDIKNILSKEKELIENEYELSND